MKVISAIGGSGSSFIIRALEKTQFGNGERAERVYELKRRLEKAPRLLAPFHGVTRFAGLYKRRLLILMRPDAFWTDWRYNAACQYKPESDTFPQDLISQREYLMRTRFLRSAGIKLRRKSISVTSLRSLVESYLEALKEFEKANELETVLISCHWGEYGIFRELGERTIYLIRDPLNSLVSHSKEARHQKSYQRRELHDINSQAWIDAYLKGPEHYWINHAESALNHKNAAILRYQRFTDDWLRLEGLPDITDQFFYRTNKLDEILSKESIDYITGETRRLCEQLDVGIPL
jgi:hypothetical protein